MIWVAMLLGFSGLLLSALFSGAETGFYRQSKVKFMLDARAGDNVARGLMYLIDRPTLFIATALVGNNLANYLVSLALVLAVDALWAGGLLQQLLGPLLMSPVLFVYGELLPKHVFYLAPNAMLRWVGIPLLGFAALFTPISGLLWAASKLLERIGHTSQQGIGLTLARRELQRVFEEGHVVGVLLPTQRQMVQGLFGLANRSILASAKPANQFTQVVAETTNALTRKKIKPKSVPAILVTEPRSKQKFIGYALAADVALGNADEPVRVRPLTTLRENESMIGALRKMQSDGERLALVVDSKQKMRGIIWADDLIDPLLRGGI